MKVVELPNKILREKSQEVLLPLNNKDEKIAKELIEYLTLANQENNDLRSGIGIAAVQLGYLKRMFYIKVPVDDGNYFEELLINPEITWFSKEEAALELGEGCLSVPTEKDRDGLVHRKNKIKIKGYSYLKKDFVEWELEGFVAIVFQHEYDHLEGKLYIDRIDYLRPETLKKHEVLI